MIMIMSPRCERALASFVALLSMCFCVASTTDGNQVVYSSRHLNTGKPLRFMCQVDSVDCYDMGDNNFQLTEDETFNSRSAIWANTPVDLDRSFVMEAQILMDSPTFVGGEGLALVFQTEGIKALGSAGHGKGYDGISNCVAVEINTHPTGPNDTSDTKISITKNSPSNIIQAIGSAELGFIKDLRIRLLRVEYDCAAKHITVDFDGSEILSGPLDLVNELGGAVQVTWGFTASSAGTLSSDQWVNFQKFEYKAQPPKPPTPKTYLREDFDKPTTAWIFQPNMFRGTFADEQYISGENSSTKFGGWVGNKSTGGIRLRLTSGSQYDPSGGWETTLVLTESVQSLTLQFSYVASIEDGFLSTEAGMVLAEVDGVGTVVETISGDSQYVGKWGDAKVEVGSFAPGTYKIKIGGYLSAPNSQGKVFQIRFDNISVAGMKDTI